MKVVLFEPQIPQNTGNIIRTCHATGSALVLVRPLGFRLGDKELKRAGLDYHDRVPIEMIDDLEAFLESTLAPFYFFSSQAKRPYTHIPTFSSDMLLIFGSETAGLPPIFREKWPERFYTLPMKSPTRCLNLSNAVSIALYRAWEALAFAGATYV